jgi:hypothetical protein
MEFYALKIGNFCKVNDNTFIKLNKFKGNFNVLSYDKSTIRLESNIKLIILNQSNNNDDIFCKAYMFNYGIYIIEKSKLKLSNKTRKTIMGTLYNKFFAKIKNEY